MFLNLIVKHLTRLRRARLRCGLIDWQEKDGLPGIHGGTVDVVNRRKI